MVSTDPSASELRSRIVRYGELRPCTSAFIDTRTPGSQEKENFTIIGPGVAENPDQHVHIDIPHGFNIGGARQPPGCVNSQHSHETAEVFVVHSGRWSFNLGETGDDARVELYPGDVISIPTNVFRGFTNVGEQTGFLFAVLGGDDPGHVTWAPYVFKAAREYGLVLLENGRLIDTTRGEQIPPGSRPMPPTTEAQVAAVQRLSAAQLNSCVARTSDFAAREAHPFCGNSAVAEAAVIGAECPGEKLPAGPMAWSHGFVLRRLRIAPGGATPFYRRAEAEVILMQHGDLKLTWAEGEFDLHAGDVMTVPTGMAHRLSNTGEDTMVAYIVRGGDQPTGYQPVADENAAFVDS